MHENFKVNVNSRDAMGTGASRRLRHSGIVPGIIYGGGEDPKMVMVDRNELTWHLSNEAFYTNILTINMDGNESSQAVLKGLQRHPATSMPTHFDFLRVKAGQMIRMVVPMHFIGEEEAPGIKREGGILNRELTELEVDCLPKDLPEFIEVDVSKMSIGDSIPLSQINLPNGVLAAIASDADPTIVSILSQSAEDTEQSDAESAEVPVIGDEAK